MVNFTISMQQCWWLYCHSDNIKPALRWLAGTLMILSVMVMTVSPEAANSPWLYGSFMAVHVLWIYTSYKCMKQQALFYQSLLLIPFDVYAIYIR